MLCPLCIKIINHKKEEKIQPIVKCKNCEISFHIHCLKKYLVENNWKDEKCNHCQFISQKNLTPLIFCKICNDKNGFLENPSNFKFFKNNMNKNYFVHSICLMAYKNNIDKIDIKKKKCKFCDLSIDNFSFLKCNEKNCNLFFHVKCIEKSKLGKLDFDHNLNFNYICQKHQACYDEKFYECYSEINKKKFLIVRNLKNQFDSKKYFLCENNKSRNILKKLNNNIFKEKFENTNEKLESFFEKIGEQLFN